MWYLWGSETNPAVGACCSVDRVIDWHVLVLSPRTRVQLPLATKFFFIFLTTGNASSWFMTLVQFTMYFMYFIVYFVAYSVYLPPPMGRRRSVKKILRLEVEPATA